MALDSTPSTVLVQSILIDRQEAVMVATDRDGVGWEVSLRIGPWHGAKRWFAETIEQRIKETGKPFPLTTRYDSQADEWFTRAGNYGIYSRDLQFSPLDR